MRKPYSVLTHIEGGNDNSSELSLLTLSFSPSSHSSCLKSGCSCSSIEIADAESQSLFILYFHWMDSSNLIVSIITHLLTTHKSLWSLAQISLLNPDLCVHLPPWQRCTTWTCHYHMYKTDLLTLPQFPIKLAILPLPSLSGTILTKQENWGSPLPSFSPHLTNCIAVHYHQVLLFSPWFVQNLSKYYSILPWAGSATRLHKQTD